MRLANIINKVYHRPMLITPSGFLSVHSIIQSKLAGDYEGGNVVFEDDGEDIFGELIPTMVIDNNIAIIPIQGVIGNHIGLIEKACGGIDIRDIKSNFDIAIGDANVDTIVLDINSPGGDASFINEVANYIYEARDKKTIVAWTSDLMASGALYLGVAAEEVYAHPAATCIGSVGVYSAYLDQSVAFANEGLKWEIFSKGKYKTQGLTGTVLSDEYKEVMQQSVDEIYQQFTAFVSKCRKQVSMEDMQGLVYSSKEALQKGFIDGLAENWKDIFST